MSRAADVAAAGGEHGIFDVDEGSALAELKLAWASGGYHGFSVSDGIWSVIGDAVRSGSHAALSAAPDEQHQVPRLERFRAAYPDVPVLPLGTCPTAWTGGERIQRPPRRGLPGGLEEIVHPDAQVSHAGGSP